MTERLAVPVWLQDAVFKVADVWCRVFYCKGWIEMRCRRCGQARYNHAFGRTRGCDQ